MKKPRLLDTFCGAGGCTAGYQRAGFYVVGVDIEPQPNYCGDEFSQADALEFIEQHGREFDVIHASPPCQAYSRATAWRGNRLNHPDLIHAVQSILSSIDMPYVIENVQEARHLLHNPFMLCGSHFNLKLRRHRFFESPSLGLILTSVCRHRADDYAHDHGGKQTEAQYRDAMGCNWMTVLEARQAIPPAYTEWIGRKMIELLELSR